MEDNNYALCKANTRLWVPYKSKFTLKLAGVFSIRVAIFAFCLPASFTVGQGGYIYHCFVIRNEKWARRKELNKEEKQVRRVTTPPSPPPNSRNRLIIWRNQASQLPGSLQWRCRCYCYIFFPFFFFRSIIINLEFRENTWQKDFGNGLFGIQWK